MTRPWLPILVLSLAALVGCGTDGPRGSCSYGGQSHRPGDTFASLDGCNTCSCSASGGDVVCTERACLPDAGAGDANGDAATDATTADAASNDASSSNDAGSGCAFARTYRFWDDGGFRAYADRSVLAPPRLHTMMRDHLANAPTTQCSRVLICSDPAVVDVGEIQAALVHADVVAALAQTTPPFYGTDSRPFDGSVFVVERDDQRGFTVGSGAVPGGLRALSDLLHTLQAQTVASADCAGL